MGVRKFRSLEEAETAGTVDPTDPRLLERIRLLWRRATLFGRLEPARGVFKYGSVEEMNRDRERRRRPERAREDGATSRASD